MLEAFFLLSGRLGRLAYFGYSVAFAIVLAIIAAILLLPLRSSPNAGPGTPGTNRFGYQP